MINYSYKQSTNDLSDSKVSIEEAIKHFEEGFRIVGGLIAKSLIQEIRRPTGEIQGEVSSGDSKTITPKEKLAYSISEVAELLGLSKGSVYEAVKTNQIPSISFGRRILIPRVVISKLLPGN